MKNQNGKHHFSNGRFLKWIVLLYICIHFSDKLKAQHPTLQQTVSVEFNDIALSEALDMLAEKTNMYFTYNSRILDDEKKTILNVSNASLLYVLDAILDDSTLHYHVIKKQIIITKDIQTLDISRTFNTESNLVFRIKGQILDSRTGKPLPYVNLGVLGKLKGAVTNLEGIFSLSLSRDELGDTIGISFIGYENANIPLNQAKDTFLNVVLHQNFIPLQEVIIRTNDPLILIKSALNKIEQNYSQKPCNYTSFYRESVKKNKTYMVYLESILDIYTSAYNKSKRISTAQILKSRKIYDVEKMDTVSFRLQGGVESSMKLDIVKYPCDFLNEKWFENFDYSLINIDTYNDRAVYVIECKQKKGLIDIYQNGIIYIDVHSLAFIKAEIYYPEKKVARLGRQVITKKASRLKAKPLLMTYEVHYRFYQGKYYFSHAKGNLKFKVKSRRVFFSSTFHLDFELANTHIETENVHRIPYKERLRPKAILSEKNMLYDSEFWGNQTFIQPEVEIQEALKRIKPQIEQSVSEVYSL